MLTLSRSYAEPKLQMAERFNTPYDWALGDCRAGNRIALSH